MKRFFSLSVLALLVVPAVMQGQNAFEGTWKIDMSKVSFPKDPNTFNLQDGMYECNTCVPPYKIAADGTDQAVTGHPYYDTVAIKVVSDKQIEETDKKDGRVVATSTATVSADGYTMRFEFSDSSNTNGGPPVTGTGEAKRVARGAPGSHAISGCWRMEKIEGLSDNANVITYKVDGKSITMTNPTGQGYTAKLNGQDAPMKGDAGITTVSVKILGKSTLVETDKREGKIIGIYRMTVLSDGKSAKGSYEDKLQNRTTEFDEMKQ